MRAVLLLLLLLPIDRGHALQLCLHPVNDTSADAVVLYPAPAFTVLGFRRASRDVTALRAANFTHFVLPPVSTLPALDAGVVVASRVPILRAEYVLVGSGTPAEMLYDHAAAHVTFTYLDVWAMREDVATPAALRVVHRKRRVGDVVVVGSRVVVGDVNVRC